MKQKTTIQKIKDIIEVANLSKKEALEGIYTDITYLEFVEEDNFHLVIRSSDFDCFSIPETIINASRRLHLSFMVSSRFRYNDQNSLVDYPVLAIRF